MPDKLAEIRDRNEERRKVRDAATPGPWEVERRYSNECEIIPRITCPRTSERGCGWVADMIGAPYLGHELTLFNADLIARSRNDTAPEDIAYLLAEIEQQAEAIACYEAMKEGVAVRIGDLEDELRRLRAEQKKVRLLAETMKDGHAWLHRFRRADYLNKFNELSPEACNDIAGYVDDLLDAALAQPGAGDAS